jgi:hypothetical protein
MGTTGRAVAGLALALAVALGTAALSRVPYDAAGGERALIRLSWRARGERVDECRKLSPAELEALPPHMRRSEVCEGKVLPCILVVHLDGREIVHDTITGAGARQDRPLYVFRELPLPPGRHRLMVNFTRERRADERPEEDSEDEEHHDYDDEHGFLATPSRLQLDAAVRLVAGEVTLVTYDPDRRTLLVRTPGERP